MVPGTPRSPPGRAPGPGRSNQPGRPVYDRLRAAGGSRRRPAAVQPSTGGWTGGWPRSWRTSPMKRERFRASPGTAWLARGATDRASSTRTLRPRQEPQRKFYGRLRPAHDDHRVLTSPNSSRWLHRQACCPGAIDHAEGPDEGQVTDGRREAAGNGMPPSHRQAHTPASVTRSIRNRVVVRGSRTACLYPVWHSTRSRTEGDSRSAVSKV
jgi:hypothetical protein